MAETDEPVIKEALALLDSWVDEADADANVAEGVALAWSTREEGSRVRQAAFTEREQSTAQLGRADLRLGRLHELWRRRAQSQRLRANQHAGRARQLRRRARGLREDHSYRDGVVQDVRAALRPSRGQTPSASSLDSLVAVAALVASLPDGVTSKSDRRRLAAHLVRLRGA
jgi:hypothetical protein